ncbi:DUF2088 domain-containing protein [Desulfallas sp. Bu1-1]|uniref:DUF2088 domain-containing protein n=1 Tax=Desulfallas sp. Bu1-1 TaxID=2787620 RepID=UPI00189E8DCC|nr:DUF2088 domain-containing protein [Desulfallas sp. Bu1-1]MBF7084068.1 DUF2088 domain-containing protein [Desulfallas sp. Bu1-1]
MKLVFYRVQDLDVPSSLSPAAIQTNISQGLKQYMGERDFTGQKIGLLVGSRGICNLALIVTTVAKYFQTMGAKVYLIPAMGSHGGATSQGQRQLLEHYGVTEAATGAEFVSSMETVCLREVDGFPVYAAKDALAMDGLVAINRIKPHTDYHARHESGLVKILAIGLGKHKGAETIHRYGMRGLTELIPLAARVIWEELPLLGGIAIVENKLDQTALVEVVPRDAYFARDAELLSMARAMMPRLPVADLDVLVVREMGKNISGVGIDPNVSGRFRIAEYGEQTGLARRLVVLDLTTASGGNALGMGIADVITDRLYQKIDFKKTYINTITSTFLQRAFMPIVAPDDRTAIKIAIDTCGRYVEPEQARMAVIKNTLELKELYITQALRSELPAGYDVAAGPLTDVFDPDGNLLLPF